ncbi:hypothetical protein QA601_12710 [Chitinispirillales bacterium ANBcel5]|uniref:hypothetical protein n=1 Tax=Cellulosispirillum alkaliphilum TaxID=3039283 RepID=UPI002A532272|nr:hypothetical protein [Chitinispirillales bacterium ANBcel5]
MGLSKEEIIDLAARYIPADEATDFPHEGDLFCLLIRETTEEKVLSEEEGWGFGGYGLCTGYTLDEDAKPAGKWLWMHFVSLQNFPPEQQVIKLQPPHVVKGRFQNPDRSREIRIVKVGIQNALQTSTVSKGEIKETPTTGAEENTEDKIVQFRKMGSKKKS